MQDALILIINVKKREAHREIIVSLFCLKIGLFCLKVSLFLLIIILFWFRDRRYALDANLADFAVKQANFEANPVNFDDAIVSLFFFKISLFCLKMSLFDFWNKTAYFGCKFGWFCGKFCANRLILRRIRLTLMMLFAWIILILLQAVFANGFQFS